MKREIKEKLEKLFEENTAGYDYVLAVEINKLLKEERNKTIDVIIDILDRHWCQNVGMIDGKAIDDIKRLKTKP